MPPFLVLLLSIAFLLCGGASAGAQDAREIVFCHYNLENYTDAIPAGETSRFGSKAKPENSVAVLIRIIREINPDILGVCEMGSFAKFDEFRKRLKDAGLDYAEHEFLEAFDSDRHLALLSRHPIVSRQSQRDVPFELNGARERVRRGFLDVTIELPQGYRLRCVGAHLKSRLPAPEDEALVRRYEAQKLRVYLDQILDTDSAANLLCYGDFNDSKNQACIQAIAGVRGTPKFMNDLPCQDELGDRWTHYWKTADEYSRIDYLFASRSLLPEIVQSRCAIYRSPDWYEASDHRPIFTAIRPGGPESR